MSIKPMSASKWPKKPQPLSLEQELARKEFLKLWHEVLPKKYGLIEKFNQRSPLILKEGLRPGIKTLEIGAGLGEHINFEDLELQDYTALEVRPDFVESIRRRFPQIKTVNADIESTTPFSVHSFDRVIAIHILEHLRNLPLALKEVKRVLKPNGVFSVVLPCEGGMAYSLARALSAKRVFEKHFKMPYAPIIKNEHVSQIYEIIYEIKKEFTIVKSDYWPLKIPIAKINLVAAFSCRPTS